MFYDQISTVFEPTTLKIGLIFPGLSRYLNNGATFDINNFLLCDFFSASENGIAIFAQKFIIAKAFKE